jgi:adenylate cyclase
MPNKLSQFWQELKRRKVLRSLAIYAGTAFIILEASSIIFPLWDFPEWSINLVLWLLILGAFINVIIAWIYDITAGGMRRTKPMEEVTPEERIPDSRVWKAATYISLVVIVGLIVLNIVGGGKQLRAGDIESLVILPFENFTGDDQLDNMVSSMHSLLCGDMGRISGLRVIGKTSSKVYKDTDLSAKDIARELNVDAVLEPTIMCLGDSVCMQFRLVSTTGEEDQIWVGDYREDKRQILNLFNRLTRQVADEVMIELTPEEERLLAKSRTVDREAYDAYLKARYYVNDFSKESLFKALDYLNSAIEKEPDWAPLYGGLAELWMNIQLGGYESPSVAAPKISENLNKAMELDPDLAQVHYLSAMKAHWVEWNWEKSEKEFLKTLAINPNDSWARLLYSQLLLILQRNDEALAQIELAAGLDPLNPAEKLLYSGTLIQAGDFAAALSVAEELVADDPMDMNAKVMLEIAAYNLGEYDEVIKSLKHKLPFSEDVYEGIVRIYNESGIVAAYEELMKHMEKYAENIPIGWAGMAGGYIIANQPDKAMDWIEKGFEAHDPQITYITATGRFYEQLFGNPRFIAICKKMNLPLPEDKRNLGII